MKKSKNSVLKTIVTMTILSVVIIGAYLYMSNNINNSSDESKIPTTEVEKLLVKDIITSYPGTPKEVIKLYIRINQSFYNEALNEDQFSKMVDQLRLLMDDELLANNPLESHADSLRSLMKENKEKKRSFLTYIVEDNSNVKYNTIDGEEYSTIYANYTVNKNGDYEKTYMEFILRQDTKKYWKILGWKVVDPKELEQ